MRARSQAEGPGAVVLGGDYQGLGIVRSLGRRGVPSCVVDDEHSIARVSRYTCGWERVADLGDGDRLADDLLRIGAERGLRDWVLYPTRDETVAAIARDRDRLKSFFRVPTPAWETIRWAWDKRNTYELAAAVGVPAPRTWRPGSTADLAAIDAPPPYAVKPAIKEHFFYATGDKAWRADDAAALADLVARALDLVGPGEVLVQELIPGGGDHQYSFCALCEDGVPLATMVARRLRQHPPEFGRASTYVETVEAAELEPLARRILAEIGFSGLAELEFKRDPRSGELKLLDFNARTWGYHTIAGQAGVDFPYLLFRRQFDQPVRPQRARAGVRWVRMLTDFPTAVGEIARRRLRLREYASSLRAAEVEAVFTRDDPMPALAEIALVPYLAARRGF